MTTPEDLKRAGVPKGICLLLEKAPEELRVFVFEQAESLERYHGPPAKMWAKVSEIKQALEKKPHCQNLRETLQELEEEVCYKIESACERLRQDLYGT